MTKRHDRSRAIRLPALQHAGLLAMGIDVPWIAAQTHLATNDEQNPTSRHEDVRSTEDQASHREPSRYPETAPVTQAVDVVATTAQKVNFVGPGVEELDLATLAERIVTCEACALCSSRHHAVVGQGVSSPVLMVIGEAPGEQEDLQGEPFVGRSGELLDNMLAAIGCTRAENVYITNVIKCRPPSNRSPREEEIEACLPYLQRQIDLIEPKAILAMGRFASQTLLKSTANVQALRDGEHFLTTQGKQLPVVVTYHPAYLLRRPVDKRKAWEDLKRVAALIHA